MNRLPDPRTPASLPVDHPFASLVEAAALTRSEGRHSRAWVTLVGALHRRLARGEEREVTSLLEAAPPGLHGLCAAAVDDAVAGIDTPEDLALATRVFLMPVLLVTGGLAPATVAGVLPDADALRATLRAAGALGPVETFALGNALGAEADARAVGPVRLHALVRQGAAGGPADLLAPAPLQLDDAAERASLRFIAGVAVTPGHAPTFLETAGQAGRWAMAASRLLAEHLGLPGLSLLPLPRPPMGWQCALAEGRFAVEETALHLFTASAVRTLRAESGDPRPVLASCSDGSVRLVLRSAFDPGRSLTHAWPLGPASDMGRVQDTITDLLRACRLPEPEVVAEVVEPAQVPLTGGLPDLFG